MRGATLSRFRAVGECSDCTHVGSKTGTRSGGNLSGLKVVPTCPATGLTKASSCHKGAGCYSACCFGGARSKLQRLRHNVEGIAAWPRAMCNHLHHPEEWEPWEENGKRVYPSHEEAEYTSLKVPRAPSPSCSGRRDHWLDLDPRALREWAMAPVAIALGLTPLHADETSRVPNVVQARDVASEGKLPSHHVYVGHGHHSHRLPTTIWKSPFVVGVNCNSDEWIPLFCQHVRCNLWDKLHTLAGMTLVCDCTSPGMCEADLLAGLVFDSISVSYASAASQTAPSRRGVNNGSAMRLVPLAAQLSPGFGLKFPFVSQEMVVLAFRRLFPEPWFANFKFPMIEDVINQAPFDSYLRWRLDQGLCIEGGFGPRLAAGGVRQLQRAAEGQQVGACAHEAALPPLLRYGLDPDEHFAAALQIGESPLPTEMLPIVDDDLKFAASFIRFSGGKLQQMREDAIGALRELHRRWKGVGAQLRKVQTDALKQTTQHRDLGFTALLVLLMNWPDVALPWGLTQGLPAVGFAPPYDVFPLQPAARLSFEDVMDGWESHNAMILSRLRPGPRDEFLLGQSLKDQDQGFCGPPLTWSELQSAIQGNPFRLIPRCVITQSSGKQRVIDDAFVGGLGALRGFQQVSLVFSPSTCSASAMRLCIWP